MAFPLHASEIHDKSETGREKHVSVPAESSYFFPFKKSLYRRGQNVTFSGKDVKKTSQVQKKISCARASHSSQKCNKCNASHCKCNQSHFLSPKKVTNVTSLTHIWDGNLGRNSAKTDPKYIHFKTTFMCPRSIAGAPSRQALPGLLITTPPSVCVPAVIGALAVWISNQNRDVKKHFRV
jgi:hypothetical protein